MKPTKKIIEYGKLLTATDTNDTARILTICINILTETRDNLNQKTKTQTDSYPYVATKTTNQ